MIIVINIDDYFDYYCVLLSNIENYCQSLVIIYYYW